MPCEDILYVGRKKELKNNYKIKENNNYLKIKKILEGDGSNE